MVSDDLIRSGFIKEDIPKKYPNFPKMSKIGPKLSEISIFGKNIIKTPHNSSKCVYIWSKIDKKHQEYTKIAEKCQCSRFVQFS